MLNVFFHLSEFTKLSFVDFFLADFASLGALNKNLTVWLDEARLANTCIPPSFTGNAPAQLRRVPIPKITFASIKKLAMLVSCKLGINQKLPALW